MKEVRLLLNSVAAIWRKMGSSLTKICTPSGGLKLSSPENQDVGETADYADAPEVCSRSCALLEPVSTLFGKESTQDLTSTLKNLSPDVEVPGLSAEVKTCDLPSIAPPPLVVQLWAGRESTSY